MQLGALEHGADALHFSPDVEELSVWDLVLPCDVEQPPEASHEGGIEMLCMPTKIGYSFTEREKKKT